MNVEEPPSSFVENRQTEAVLYLADSTTGMANSGKELADNRAFPTLFLIALAALYGSFGILFGLISGTLPPLLRSRGFDMGQIGWMFVLFIPFGLTFLWSPIIDAFQPSRRAPKMSWIVLTQLIIIVVLVITAQLQTAEPILLLALGIIVALATATMDLALDALASESVPEKYRPLAGSLKAGTYLIGLVIGGGVLMALSAQIGWTGLFRLVAVITAISTLPIFFCSKYEQARKNAKLVMPSLIKTFSRERNLRRLTALMLLNCVFSSMMGLSRIMLVDIGLPLDVIGKTVGIIGPLVGLAASIVAVPLLNRLGNGKTLLICLAYGTLTLIGLVTGLNVWPKLALVSTIAMSAASSGLFVIICTSLLGWAKGSQPATDYATLLGLGRLTGTLFVMTSSMLIPHIGWASYYSMVIILFPVATLITMTLLPEVFGLKKNKTIPKHS